MNQTKQFCMVCGSKQVKRKYHMPIKNIPKDQEFVYRASTDVFGSYGTIVECTNCGLVFIDPLPDDDTLTASYASTSDPEYTSEGSSRSINAHLCLSTIKTFKQKGKLLDIGCSTGFFLNAARVDFDAEGVELSQWAAAYAQNKFRLTVHQGNIFSIRYPDQTFDVITLIDVIEHLSHPTIILDEINRILKDDGILYMVTPNIRSLSARVLGKRWWGLRPAHLIYFSPITLGHALKKSHFAVQYCKSYGRIFTYQYWLSRIKNYNRFVYAVVEFVISKLKIGPKFLYINTRDSMEIIAVKQHR
ncbi:MAG: methyltransferase domain-containing protein [Elusimicrobia bacterium]|nr:methyltransferase domain-containing protein [Elusimicrobiota bacterium]